MMASRLVVIRYSTIDFVVLNYQDRPIAKVVT